MDVKETVWIWTKISVLWIRTSSRSLNTLNEFLSFIKLKNGWSCGNSYKPILKRQSFSLVTVEWTEYTLKLSTITCFQSLLKLPLKLSRNSIIYYTTTNIKF